jgi:hypothetical protein
MFFNKSETQKQQKKSPRQGSWPQKSELGMHQNALTGSPIVWGMCRLAQSNNKPRSNKNSPASPVKLID